VENDANQTIRPVAWAGVEDGYLAQAGITWADTERGRGPAGVATRSGSTDCSQDIAADPRMAPWRDNALQRGYRSTIALPLKDENANVFGVFLIYSSEPNVFTHDEIRLMEELAGDLAFGIQTLRNRNERKRVEETLHLQTVELEQEVAERQLAQENLQEQALLLENEIEERRNAQDELEQLNDELENRVQERTLKIQNSEHALINIVNDVNQKTCELEKANAKLLELDQLKSMFIASMSHELRTPLNSIIGFSSIIRDEWLGPVNPEQKENLNTIQSSGKHLLSLINDVIDVSKIEAGRIEVCIEEFDLYDLLTEAVQYVEKDLRDKGLELRLDMCHHPFCTDKRRLLQCVINLLSNAVKFTEHGNVTVSSAVIDTGLAAGECGPSGMAIQLIDISIGDTGIGINEEDIHRLFGAFVRLESQMKTPASGTGLGLYLTRKLVVEVLRGDILCNSTLGIGSTFTLRIPDI
jgi:signal transduction histidine kinase